MKTYELELTLKLPNDGLTIKLTGETVDFIKDNPEAQVRPRHARLAANIIDIIKESVR